MTLEERRAKRRTDYNERYYLYKEHGVCPKCGTNNAEKGKVLCTTCLRTYAAYTVLGYYKHIKKGICPKCGQPLQEGYSYCPDCLDKNRQIHKKLYKERKESGLCPRCGRKRSDTSKVYCERCREKQRQRDMQKKAA